MGMFTFIMVVVVVLAIMGLGWKTFASGVIGGFDVAIEKGGPAVQNLVDSGKDYINNQSDDVIQETIDGVLNK